MKPPEKLLPSPRSVRDQLRDATSDFRGQSFRVVVGNKSEGRTAALLRVCRMLMRPGTRLIHTGCGAFKVEGVESHEMLMQIGCKRIEFIAIPISHPEPK
jgi:hypothetical protein